MKKTIQFLGATLLSLLSITLFAQQTEQEQKPVEQEKATNTWDAKNNPVVQEITSKYQDKLIAPKPALTTKDIFPAIGVYESTDNPEAKTIVITLDEQNKGLVWVEGLPQGKIKAMLRKSPAVYKIPAQKTEDGKDVAEGTLIYDKETNTLSICIGKNYNYENPSQVFDEPQMTEEPAEKDKKAKAAKVKEPKPWMYSGLKVVSETAKN